MFVMPVMLLPYVWFSMWMEMLGGPVKKAPVRDPLADAGAGSTSTAAITRGTGRALVQLADTTR